MIQAAFRARDRQDAHALVFPELTLTGYPLEDLLLRPELLRRVERAPERICRYTAGLRTGPSLPPDQRILIRV